jgi:hypothetical protein
MPATTGMKGAGHYDQHSGPQRATRWSGPTCTSAKHSNLPFRLAGITPGQFRVPARIAKKAACLTKKPQGELPYHAL